MAKITIRNRRRDERAIPDLCARCGEVTEYTKSKQFSWHPPWISVLLIISWPIYIILAIVLTKKRTLQMPLCDQHRSHWIWPPVIILGGLVVLLTLVAALVVSSSGGPGNENVFAPIFGVGLVVFLLAWLIAIVVIQNRTIRPAEITEDRIILTNVSQEFVDEFEDRLVEEARSRRMEREAEAEEEGRGGRSRRSEDDRVRRASRDEEEDRPRRPARRNEEDEEQERPRRTSRRDEAEEERPRRSTRGAEEDDDEPDRRKDGYRRK